MLSHSDLDDQIERLKRCEYIKESEVKTLCDKAREILVDEGNVQLVPAPVTVSLWSIVCKHSKLGEVFDRREWEMVYIFYTLLLSVFFFLFFLL